MDDLLTDFLAEVNEGLAELDTALVSLERNPGDGPTLSLIFRQMHTIKGTCGFLGLPRLERVAHAAEDVLGRLRDATLSPTSAVIDVVLASLDRIRVIVAALQATGAEPADENEGLLQALDRVLHGRESVDASPVIPHVSRTELGVSVADDAASERGDAIDLSPSKEPGGSATGPATVRVAVDTLETLMTLVGELVLTRNQLLQLARESENSPFAAPFQRLSRIAGELQDIATRTRMQPVGNAWSKLPRLVRDLSHELGKPIALLMNGAETELDRQVLEQIRDPLTHIIRNAADHGLESPAARRAAGKPELGRITLDAFHEGGHVVIVVADDGGGLAVDRIRARVIARGLSTEAELAAMSEVAISRFIFAPGFSTAETVTSLSGRGVGLDVVRSNVERLSGTIDLASRPGEGTVFTIRIPLTLAIVPGLLVSVANERFAIPQLAVVELVQPSEPATTGTRVEQIGDRAVLRLRDQLLPLVSLSGLLNFETARPATDSDAGERPIVAVIQAGEVRYGLLVDCVFDTEEIVVKPVAPALRPLTPFGGVTILGDGSPTMILDPAGIARAARITPISRTVAEIGQTTEAPKEAFLIVRASNELFATALASIARIEAIATRAIERSSGRLLVPYRGALLPLVPITGMPSRDEQLVLVIGAEQDAIGLVVDEVVETLEAPAPRTIKGARPGVLGSTMLNGHVVAIIDTSHFVERAHDALPERVSRPSLVRTRRTGPAARKVA